jgi:tRNA(Ile)-lysidine synthase
LLAGGESVLVAVSGGGDSVALLHVLHRLAPRWRLALHALHVDHQLRAGSAGDGDFVEGLAAKLGIPCAVARVTVDARGSREAAARRARYRALEEHADRVGAQRIAVAHTADDQAETVLMRVLEGTGVRGLAGIPPRRGRIIRPLIAERRDTLRAVLVDGGIEWIEDPSNAERAFVRNRLRHDLIPALRDAYNPDIVAALVRLAGLARATAGALEGIAARELAGMARPGPGELVLPLGALRALPGEIAAEVLRQGAVRLGSRAALRAWGHRGLRRALASPPPRRPFILGGVTVDVSGGRVRLGRGPGAALVERSVPIPGRLALPEAGLMLETWVGAAAAWALARDPWRAVFDAEALAGPLLVRRRRAGDRMQPFGAARERRVKSMLIAAGIPRWERDSVPIVQAGPDIVWIGGVRRGATAPVAATTRRVLHLILAPLAEGGGAASPPAAADEGGA